MIPPDVFITTILMIFLSNAIYLIFFSLFIQSYERTVYSFFNMIENIVNQKDKNEDDEEDDYDEDDYDDEEEDDDEEDNNEGEEDGNEDDKDWKEEKDQEDSKDKEDGGYLQN
jgi:nucleosome binding factor SPN SPT16 subunit